MLLIAQDREPRHDNHKMSDPPLQPDVGLLSTVQAGRGFAGLATGTGAELC